MTYRFNLEENHSPTYHNLSRHLQALGWKKTHLEFRSHLCEKHFAFNAAAAQCLEYKHLLAKLAQNYGTEALPTTLNINDINWPSVLADLAKEVPGAWILKPSLLNNGQYIKIFDAISALEKHYAQGNRLGGEHVLQRYIARPHLLKGPSEGHKYSVRLFVVLTNFAGAFLYPRGYFNVALKPYDANNTANLAAHLTNEHLFENTHNIIQIPTTQYDLFKPLYPKMKIVASDIVKALQQQYPKAFMLETSPALALFGFDFMVDADEKVWLLEANHAPCFPIEDDHPLQNTLYHDFWRALIERFIAPIATGKVLHWQAYHPFEIISK